MRYYMAATSGNCKLQYHIIVGLESECPEGDIGWP
jgi:hypothetical protein